jgi:peptidoglycan/xylan/chitin deacetylase (PgdA/CDA1 family)
MVAQFVHPLRAGRITARRATKAALSALLPRRFFTVSGARGSRRVWLTFDDGPHPEHTPRLLDVLRDAGVPATFFVIGRGATAHPEIVRRMKAEGHAVGNHTFNHVDAAAMATASFIEEVRRADRVLEAILGHEPRLFRPPWGRLRAAQYLRLFAAGKRVVLWNNDPNDGNGSPAETTLAWFRSRPPRGGDIVLMHDDHPHAALVLPELIAAARAEGLEFGRLS